MLNGKPYEIFTGLQEQFIIPNSIETGKIRRTKLHGGGGKYDFLYVGRNGGEHIVEDLHVAFDKEYWNYAKLISGVLRHGMPIRYAVALISGLNLRDDNLNTWKAGVGRALKRYIPNDTVDNKVTCEGCGSIDGLIYSEGCLTCRNCGWSKC